MTTMTATAVSTMTTMTAVAVSTVSSTTMAAVPMFVVAAAMRTVATEVRTTRMAMLVMAIVVASVPAMVLMAMAEVVLNLLVDIPVEQRLLQPVTQRPSISHIDQMRRQRIPGLTQPRPLRGDCARRSW